MKIGVSVPLNTNQPIHKHWFFLLFAFLFFFTSQSATHSKPIIIKRLNMSIFWSHSRVMRWRGRSPDHNKGKQRLGICRLSGIAKVASRLLKWRSQEINWRRLKSVFPYHLSPMWLIYSNISYTTKCEISAIFLLPHLSRLARNLNLVYFLLMTRRLKQRPHQNTYWIVRIKATETFNDLSRHLFLA